VKAVNKQAKLDAFMKEKENVNNIEEDEEKIQGPYDLPKGWKWITLKELIVKGPQYGLTAKSEKEGRILYIRITDVDSLGRLISTDLHYVNVDEETFEKYTIKPGDILIARSGATAGKAFLCKEPMNAVFGSYLIRFQVDERKVLPNYLFYFFLSDEYWNQVKSWKIGGAQPNVNAQNLKKLKVPLPPLEEQKHIVSRLEQLVSRAEEAKSLRKLAREEAEKIMQAALNKVFSKAEEEGWEWAKFGTLLTRKPQYGLTAKSSQEEKEVRYIRISDITDHGELKNDDPRFLDLSPEEYEKYKLEENEILIARSGSVGRVYLHCPTKQKCVFASYLIRFKLNSNKLLPKFFFYFGLSSLYREFVENTLRKVAQPNINAKEYCKLEVPLPPLKEQEEMVAYLDRINEIRKIISRLQQKTEEELGKLVPAILDKAFKGELQ